MHFLKFKLNSDLILLIFKTVFMIFFKIDFIFKIVFVIFCFFTYISKIAFKIFEICIKYSCLNKKQEVKKERNLIQG